MKLCRCDFRGSEHKKRAGLSSPFRGRNARETRVGAEDLAQLPWENLCAEFLRLLDRLCVCQVVYPLVCLYACLSVRVNLLVCLSACLPVCLSVCLPACLLACLPVRVYLLAYLPVGLPICPPLPSLFSTLSHELPYKHDSLEHRHFLPPPPTLQKGGDAKKLL